VATQLLAEAAVLLLLGTRLGFNSTFFQSEALAQDPLLVKRLRRLRATRQRNRSAKRLGIALTIE